MRKTKVAICINDFLVGGAQRMLAQMLHKINREEFEPVLISLFYWEGKDYFYELLPPGISVHQLSFGGFLDAGSWFKLYRLLRALDPDIVLSNLFFSNTVLRILKPFFRYKAVIVEHNTYINKDKLHQVADRILARATARIVAVSNTVLSFTAKQENIPVGKFTVIHNGIDISNWQNEIRKYDPEKVKAEMGLAPGQRVILNVARLTTQKNPALLLEGFAVFSRKHSNYSLAIVGGGGKWTAILKEKARSLGVSDRVFLMGTQKDVARFYAIADFFVSTSTIEGFGIAHAEALACGVPVLSTKTAGPDEMIKEGENGYFISEGTPESVAEGMEKIAATDLKAMGARAKESAREYGIEKTTAAYENLFRKVLAK